MECRGSPRRPPREPAIQAASAQVGSERPHTCDRDDDGDGADGQRSKDAGEQAGARIASSCVKSVGRPLVAMSQTPEPMGLSDLLHLVRNS